MHGPVWDAYDVSTVTFILSLLRLAGPTAWGSLYLPLLSLLDWIAELLMYKQVPPSMNYDHHRESHW
jgi:hypothetical protein